jgi:uncharacterized protein DUF4129
MISWKTYILACSLFAATFCRADSQPGNGFTSAEYSAELDGLLAATQQLDSSGTATPAALEHLPHSWHVHTENGDFDVSTAGLRSDVRRYEKEKNQANAVAIRTRLASLRKELAGFEKAPLEVSNSRTELNSILARPEFRDVHGPTWWDRLKRWMIGRLIRLVSKLFRSTAIPNVGKYFVYGLIGLAGLGLLYLVYRSIFQNPEFEEVVPKDLPVSAKEWTIWLSEARAAAGRSDWRDAVHLAYWAGISFLERQGQWKPDRARTPREYLRLISPQAEQRETLGALTHIFELTWYAKRPAGESTFSETLEQLEKLGCR